MQVRAPARSRNITVTALWLAAMLGLTLTWPTTYLPLEAVLVAAPAWYVFVTIERTIKGARTGHPTLIASRPSASSVKREPLRPGRARSVGSGPSAPRTHARAPRPRRQ